jgi:hypothetical protein
MAPNIENDDRNIYSMFILYRTTPSRIPPWGSVRLRQVADIDIPQLMDVTG